MQPIPVHPAAAVHTPEPGEPYQRHGHCLYPAQLAYGCHGAPAGTQFQELETRHKQAVKQALEISWEEDHQSPQLSLHWLVDRPRAPVNPVSSRTREAFATERDVSVIFRGDLGADRDPLTALANAFYRDSLAAHNVAMGWYSTSKPFLQIGMIKETEARPHYAADAQSSFMHFAEYVTVLDFGLTQEHEYSLLSRPACAYYATKAVFLCALFDREGAIFAFIRPDSDLLAGELCYPPCMEDQTNRAFSRHQRVGRCRNRNEPEDRYL
ncbi:hypothetical protein LOZ53_005412 [Ophidiomyces ophidiicola]|nr:hypothetical protein LOZ54_006348 [Ophidiomyces ophidiicola]KAI1981119.1 hypothetical protein LOZ55_001005 [Ophidiomyces ophidiicola]KAI1984550.1 hypothetical protein LOZ53_005412 [Ophidiomyces ophidiicola]KAI1990415.1 hypothetical protein LOZ51_004766 [Ophidiomyces ophidiicola]